MNLIKNADRNPGLDLFGGVDFAVNRIDERKRSNRGGDQIQLLLEQRAGLGPVQESLILCWAHLSFTAICSKVIGEKVGYLGFPIGVLVETVESLCSCFHTLRINSFFPKCCRERNTRFAEDAKMMTMVKTPQAVGLAE